MDMSLIPRSFVVVEEIQENSYSQKKLGGINWYADD